MSYTVALEDDLLRQWHAFKHAQPHDPHVLERLLPLYRPPHITCTGQLQRIGVQDQALLRQLASVGLINQSVEDLAAETGYKLALAWTRNIYPYVCIQGDSITSEYIVTIQPGGSREKAHALLRALTLNARNILIHDRHLQRTWRDARAFFDLLPKKPLSLSFSPSLDQSSLTQLKKECPEWRLQPDKKRTYPSHHDRYLRIDDTTEVVVTSGLDYLFDTTKECTLIVRKLD